MNFTDYSWHDCHINRINIEYDKATIEIGYYEPKPDVKDIKCTWKCFVVCTGLAGITNLCIWDDTIIYDTNVRLADPNDDFVRKLYGAYSKEWNFGGRSLSNDLYELQIELVNNITFSIYCQKIEVIPDNEEK